MNQSFQLVFDARIVPVCAKHTRQLGLVDAVVGERGPHHAQLELVEVPETLRHLEPPNQGLGSKRAR
jgi:hypothetical protein